MAFTFQVFPELHLRVLVMSAVVTHATIRASVQGLLASPEYDASHDVLVDFRPTATVNLSADFIAALARDNATPPATTRVSRVAVVTDSDEQFGVGRMFGAYRDETPDRLQVFRSAAEACAWLGVPKDLLP